MSADNRTPAEATELAIRMAVARHLKLARERAKMSQAELARQCGVSTQMIQKYESGRNRIAVDRLCRMAVVLRQPLDVFLGYLREHSVTSLTSFDPLLDEILSLPPKRRLGLRLLLRSWK